MIVHGETNFFYLWYGENGIKVEKRGYEKLFFGDGFIFHPLEVHTTMGRGLRKPAQACPWDFTDPRVLPHGWREFFPRHSKLDRQLVSNAFRWNSHFYPAAFEIKTKNRDPTFVEKFSTPFFFVIDLCLFCSNHEWCCRKGTASERVRWRGGNNGDVKKQFLPETKVNILGIGGRSVHAVAILL